MQLPAYIQGRADGVWLSVRVQPRASKNEISGAVGNELKIKVTAPPVDAAANAALIELLAETLNCPRSRIDIVRGHKSRHKTVGIGGLKPEQVAERLMSR